MQQDSDSEVIDTGVVADDGQRTRPSGVECANQVFRNPADTKATHQD